MQPDPPAADPVPYPAHDHAGKVECIDAIEAALGPDGFRAFLRGQILKSIWRGPHKGAERQNYARARSYLDRLIGSLPEA